MTRAKTRKRRPLLTLLLILALIPVGGVVLHRFVPPLFTILMVKQAVAGHGMDYRWRSLNHISPRLVEAVIAAEDARFCQHHGFDVEAIQKAMEANERAEQRGSDKRRGASTISQQTAKNVFLWPSRDWVRKGLEVGYTGLIEIGWGKRRIMEMYLNVAEWAPGVYGAEAASQHWFHKSAENLTAREAARLAAILPSPLKWKAAQPGPYVKRRSGKITRAAGTINREGMAACVLS